MNNKLFRMIGLCYRSGKADTGEAKAEEKIRLQRAYLTVLSEDASENTAKKFRKLCEKNGVPLICTGDRELLGKYTGRDFAVVITISDENFADAIMKIADNTSNL